MTAVGVGDNPRWPADVGPGEGSGQDGVDGRVIGERLDGYPEFQESRELGRQT
jgi:hypothetical protein